jgi:hypothetical protein
MKNIFITLPQLSTGFLRQIPDQPSRREASFVLIQETKRWGYGKSNHVDKIHFFRWKLVFNHVRFLQCT